MGLVHIFGKKPIPAILDFLMVHRNWDYSLKDISEATGTSFRTLQRVVPFLERAKMMKRTRTEGKAQMYIINFDSSVVRKLDELAMEADLEFAEKQKEPFSHRSGATAPERRVKAFTEKIKKQKVVCAPMQMTAVGKR